VLNFDPGAAYDYTGQVVTVLLPLTVVTKVLRRCLS
jgi:hypothetical protein